MTYTLAFAAVRVDTGVLQIMATAPPQVEEGAVNWNNSDTVRWTPPLADFGKSLQDYAFSVFQRSLGSYEQAFLKGLAGQNKLVLPGSGDYLCNKVMFSKRGDLLTNLVFNG